MTGAVLGALLVVGHPGAMTSDLIIFALTKNLRDSTEGPHDTCQGILLIDVVDMVDMYLGQGMYDPILSQKILVLCQYFMEGKDWWRGFTIYDRLQPKISPRVFRMCPERFIPRWPRGQELEVEDAPSLNRFAGAARRDQWLPFSSAEAAENARDAAASRSWLRSGTVSCCTTTLR